MKVKDIKPSKKPPHILIHGPAGTGKTGLVSQASRGKLYDFDGGIRTAINLKDHLTKYRMEIDVDTFVDENPKQPNAWLKAKTEFYGLLGKINRGQFPFDCLVIDSLSGMARTCESQIMKACGDPLGKPQIQHYGMMVSELTNMIHLITTLPLLVLVTAHEYPLSVGDETYIKPKVIGRKLPCNISSLFDEVWWSTVKKTGVREFEWRVSWVPNKYIETRTRSGELKEVNHAQIGLRGLLKEIGYEY